MQEHRQFQSHVHRLLQDFKFTSDLNSIVQSQIADVVYHASRKAGDVLWKQGDPPDSGCYIILTGEVEMWESLPKSASAPNVPEFVEGNSRVRRHCDAIVTLLEMEGDMAPHEIVAKRKNKSLKKREVKLERSFSPSRNCEVHIKTLAIGVMFGEESLLQDHPRFSTFKCKTDCQFLHINKNNFDRVVKQSVNQARNKQISGPMRQFLREFDWFQKLSQPLQNRVPEIMLYQRYSEGSLVFREGEDPHSVYIILTGEVWICRADAASNSKAARQIPADCPKQGLAMRMKAAAMLSQLRQKEETTRVQNWVEAEKVAVNDLGGVVSKLGSGHMFGELAFVDNTPRSTSVICATNCEFLALDLDYYQEICKAMMFETQVVQALPQVVQPLLEKVPFFREFPPSVRENAAYCMQYYMERHGQVLSWEGDIGDRCFLILSGTVSVWKSKGEEGMQEPLNADFSQSMALNAFPAKRGSHFQSVAKGGPFIQADREVCKQCDAVADHLSQMARPAGFDDLIVEVSELVKRAKSNQADINEKLAARGQADVEVPAALEGRSTFSTSTIMDVLGLQVASLGQGIVFGERALVTDEVRNATIICEDTCQLLVMSRVDFERVIKQDTLRAKVKQNGGSIKRLLREFDLFKDLSQSVQDQLADIIHYYKARQGTILYEVDDSPKFCYILLSGEVTIWQRLLPEELEATVANSKQLPVLARTGSPKQREQQQQQQPHEQLPTHDSGQLPNDSALAAEGERRRSVNAARPAVELASALACERCVALATMLSAVAVSGMSTQPGTATNNLDHMEDDSMLCYTHNAVAALGTGSLFGELALLNDQPRSDTLSCFKDCEFLIIDKHNFDRLLKAEMNKAFEDKLQFLRTHVPGLRSLQSQLSERVMYYFNKATVPKNHVFLRQGDALPADMYFVWEGSVESYSNLDNGGFRRRGIMLKGSIFGDLPKRTPAPYTIVATSSPCEVLRLKREDRKHIPECVLACMREMVDANVARRQAQCTPLVRMLPTVSALSRPSSQGSCRPDSRGSNTGGRRGCLTPNKRGLFQRIVTDVDYKVFELTPGESLAMSGQKPIKRREKRHLQSLLNSLQPSASAPAFPDSLGSSMASSDVLPKTCWPKQFTAVSIGIGIGKRS